MKPQFIQTEAGEDLVVLTRRAYDALLARGGDAEAEDRMTARIVDAHLADVAAGRSILLPDWLAEAMAEGMSALRAARKHRKMTKAALARAANLPPGAIGEIENGDRPADAAALARIAAALDCEPAWLE